MDAEKLYPKMTEELAAERADRSSRQDESGGRKFASEKIGAKLYQGMEGAEPRGAASASRPKASAEPKAKPAAERETAAAPRDWEEQVATWEKQSRADEEIGGERLEESLETARKVLDTYGTRELLEALDEHGLGSHPDLIRLLVRIGRERAR